MSSTELDLVSRATDVPRGQVYPVQCRSTHVPVQLFLCDRQSTSSAGRSCCPSRSIRSTQIERLVCGFWLNQCICKASYLMDPNLVQVKHPSPCDGATARRVPLSKLTNTTRVSFVKMGVQRLL